MGCALCGRFISEGGAEGGNEGKSQAGTRVEGLDGGAGGDGCDVGFLANGDAHVVASAQEAGEDGGADEAGCAGEENEILRGAHCRMSECERTGVVWMSSGGRKLKETL